MRGAVSPSTEPEQRRQSRAFRVIAGLVVARAVGPGAVNYLQQPHYSSYVTDVVSRTALAENVADVTTVVLALYCLFVTVRPGAARGAAGGTIVFCLAIVSWSLLAYPDVTRLDVANAVLTVLVAVAVWRTGPSLRSLSTVSGLAAVVALFAMVGGLWQPETFMFADRFGQLGRSEKALIGSDQLAGPFGHSNTLGIFCALALPLALLLSTRRARWLVVLVLSAALVWSSSRTSLLAVALVGAAALVAVVLPLRLRLRAGLVGLAGVLAWATILPFVTDDPRAFTRRGAIWQVSLDAWSDARWTGHGLDWYLTEGVMIPVIGREASSGHNLVVHALTVGGLLGVGLVLVALAPALRVAARGAADPTQRCGPVIGFLLVFGILSTLEFAWVTSPTQELFPVVGFVVATLAAVAVPPRVAADDNRQVAATGPGLRSPMTRR